MRQCREKGREGKSGCRFQLYGSCLPGQLGRTANRAWHMVPMAGWCSQELYFPWVVFFEVQFRDHHQRVLRDLYRKLMVLVLSLLLLNQHIWAWDWGLHFFYSFTEVKLTYNNFTY